MSILTPPAEILYEDNHLLAVNKMPGQISQGDKTGDEPLGELLKQFIKKRDRKPGNVFMGTVHRLDRPVGGVIIFAKTSKALERLNRIFAERNIRKTYWAICGNRPDPPEGHLEHYMQRNRQQNKSRALAKKRPDAKRAELNYKLLSSIDRYHLLEITPQTGRHHQIRAQLAAIGCPIRGDLKYGFARSNADGSISLHARCLEMEHPVRKTPLKITAAPNANDHLWLKFEPDY